MVGLVSSGKNAMTWRWHHPMAHNSTTTTPTATAIDKTRRPKYIIFVRVAAPSESLRCDSTQAGGVAILQVLNLRSNERSGPIPSSLGVGRALQLVLLNSHQLSPTLSGAIPHQLVTLMALQKLRLEQSQLTDGKVGGATGATAPWRELHPFPINQNLWQLTKHVSGRRRSGILPKVSTGKRQV
ncbi:conserved unknown protein [Ectocarpus siliculosus]|uniref:Uncharacterized protein n=1 Tax=Ectocarpus siliculosus TaxID=2880 RepID=D8LD85_ECTSI|nr:conserved unknown protein [Ectocarpus siliculosus]|eukprot:CBN75538.1 conserved unknown protein [Ectocarpus siliculosus]